MSQLVGSDCREPVPELSSGATDQAIHAVFTETVAAGLAVPQLSPLTTEREIQSHAGEYSSELLIKTSFLPP